MNKTILILFLALFFSSFSYSGGDDRDQVLPFNSLNEELEAFPSILQEENPDQEGSKDMQKEIQDKIIESEKKKSQSSGAENNENSIAVETDRASISIIDKYIKSDQGILILLLLSVVGLILLFSFFVREKN